MPKHKVGDHLRVKLSGGRIAEATVKAIVDTDGRCALASVIRERNGTDLFVADRHRASLIVSAAPIVEERRVRRQAGDLGESEDEWKREFKTEWRSKSE